MAKPYAALAMPICQKADTAWLLALYSPSHFRLLAYAVILKVLAKCKDDCPKPHVQKS